MFFDRAEVLKKVEAKERRLLASVGGFARTTIKRSFPKPVKKNKPGEPPRDSKPSPPGHPPRRQTGILYDAIFFGYDSSSRSVVVGPLKRSTKSGASDTPVVLNEGGVVRNALLRVVEGRGKKRRERFFRKTFTLKPRPYVGPKSQKHEVILDFWRKKTKDSLT